MTRTRRTFFAVLGLTATVLAAGLFFKSGQFAGLAGRMNGLIATTPVIQPVRVTIASSITKQRWLENAAANFAAGGATTASGRPIQVSVKGMLSGDSMEQVLDGRLKPVVWSPGEFSWVDQFKQAWSLGNKEHPFSQPCSPTVLTPLGMGMWRPMAEALGWPNKPIGWKTIIELAKDPQGWGRFGHPEWGRLKLGHTHPQYSSAGLLFLTSAIHGELGSTDPLKPETVYQPAVDSMLATLAQNTAKYGLSTANLLNAMAVQGPDFVHVISAFEEAVVRTNMQRANELRWPLVFVFPSDGTFWSNHPYCVLDRADWVTSDEADGARKFLAYLKDRPQQELAVQDMLRPLDAAVPIVSPLIEANGTQQSARPETVPALPEPDASSSKAIIDQFRSTKRKATVLLVLDVSGSMNGEPIRSATSATAGFLERLDPADQVGLMIFNDTITTVSSVHKVADVAETLAVQTRNLMSGGGTNLHGAVCRAMQLLAEQRKSDINRGESRLYGIVLLSDGADTTGEISENRMYETCLPRSREALDTRIYSIAFGAEASRPVLQRISTATGGQMFEADGSSIEQAYLKISAEQ